MGGIPTPAAAAAIASCTGARLKVSDHLVGDWGLSRWNEFRAEAEANALKLTGIRHGWRYRIRDYLWELVPVEGE